MAILMWEFPADSDAWPCPEACGGLTEDPAGGPCKCCWDKVPGSRMMMLAMESDLAARRGERELPRRQVILGPMDPGDVVEPGS